MSSIDRNNPFAPPEAVVADMAEVTGAGELAGRWSRLGAALLDGAISGALTYGASKAIGVAWLSEDTSLTRLFPLYVASFVLFTLVQGWFLHTRSQTIGKIALGIRIKRSDGTPAMLGRTLGLRIGVMWLVAMIPVVGPLVSLADSLFIFGKSRRCLHDFIADTIVVKA
ncbi:MAG TPA: RDD family protein [Ideonella sp.]|uniref:RDD family protein n=1 Tax=Ideonella sp. TaxID=1929293 RepID=UPI002BAB4759|nr:RDD family protein [Ideonella sp.]HSI49392.1 RDD family protein [Ideonella sp.]